MAKKQPSKSDVKRLRTQQIIFTLIAVMIIIVMVLGLVAK
jgi:predicted nucleic acid-binding Zn ribbon protein